MEGSAVPFTLPVSWVTTTEKWPTLMTKHLETLMLQHNYFAVYKREPASIATLELIVDEFQPYFNPPITDREHLRAFIEKIKHKITRVRTELLSRGVLMKTATGFILSPDGPPTREPSPVANNPQRHVQLQEWIQRYCPGLTPMDADFAITTFLRHIDHLRRPIEFSTKPGASSHATGIDSDVESP